MIVTYVKPFELALFKGLIFYLLLHAWWCMQIYF